MPFSPGTRPRLGVPSARRGVAAGLAACRAEIASDEAPATAITRTIEPRRVLRTCLLWCARGGEKPLPGACEDDRPRVRERFAAPGEAAVHRHDITDLQRVPRPSLVHQAVRAAHLER